MKKPDPTQLKTRPDLGDQEWLVWLGAQPENKSLRVAELYRAMLDWCLKKGKTPSRRRLLRWLDTEREAVPMTFEPAYFTPPPQPAPEPVAPVDTKCTFCGKDLCLLLHREEI